MVTKKDQLLMHRVEEDEEWEDCLVRTFKERLNLDLSFQLQHLEVIQSTYSFKQEGQKLSKAYPSIPTSYCSHEVHVRIIDPLETGLSCLGLPAGRDFVTRQVG